MGTLGRIEELREVVRQNGLGRACTSGNGLWHDADAHDGWRISGGMGPEPIHTGLEEGGPPADWAELPMAEVNLMRESAPAHPAGVWMHQGVRPRDRNAAIIALANGITPALAREYLAGRLEDVRGPAPEACPQAGRRRSWCGRLQAEGAISFPLTDDGGYRDCRYFRFLEDHGELEPGQRERYADAELAGSRKKSGKRGQTRGGETGRDDRLEKIAGAHGTADEKLTSLLEIVEGGRVGKARSVPDPDSPSQTLYEHLRGYPWFLSIGEGAGELIIYTRKQDPMAKKVIPQEWEGLPVTTRNTGTPRTA